MYIYMYIYIHIYIYIYIIQEKVLLPTVSCGSMGDTQEILVVNVRSQKGGETIMLMVIEDY